MTFAAQQSPPAVVIDSYIAMTFERERLLLRLWSRTDHRLCAEAECYMYTYIFQTLEILLVMVYSIKIENERAREKKKKNE